MPCIVKKEVWLCPHRVRAPAGAIIKKEEKKPPPPLIFKKNQRGGGLFVLQDQNTGLSQNLNLTKPETGVENISNKHPPKKQRKLWRAIFLEIKINQKK